MVLNTLGSRLFLDSQIRQRLVEVYRRLDVCQCFMRIVGIEGYGEILTQRSEPIVIGQWQLLILMKQPVGSLKRAENPIGSRQE